MTVSSLLASLYPKDRTGSLDPKWEGLRGAIEHFAPPKPGCPPDGGLLGKVLSRFKGAAVRTSDHGPARRFVPDGLTHGRARWKVEDVPRPAR